MTFGSTFALEHQAKCLICNASTPSLKIFQFIVREFLYADDADIVAHPEEVMQMIMGKLCSACTAFGFTISLKKIYAMYTPPIGLQYFKPNIMVEEKRLKLTDSFSYLGITLSRDGTLDTEINHGQRMDIICMLSFWRVSIKKASRESWRLYGSQTHQI